MGARLSLLAPSAPTVAISSFVDILQNIQYLELVNNSRFLKTIKAVDTSTGNLIIIKILIKPAATTAANYNINLHDVSELIIKELSLISQFNNVLPWHKLIETDRAGYLIRQLIKTNLYDRLSLRPFLEPIEKAFLVFQMLKILDNIHNTVHIHHGDLKSENFLVTSWNWLMLTDFACYTKPTFIPEDNPSQFSFYFDNSGRRSCYIAPERFYNSKDTPAMLQNISDDGKFTGKDLLTDEMDLFSLGCVIAELYLDGEPTFTLSQLFKYMKNEYSPDFSGISDDYIREIVKSLIQLNPNDRPSLESLLLNYRDKCFPSFFYDFLYDFMSGLNNVDVFNVSGDDNTSSSDLKIAHIYDNFEGISQALHFNYSTEETKASFNQFVSYGPLKLNLPGIPPNYSIRPTATFINKDSKDLLEQASLVILNLIFSLMNTLKLPSSKIKACELIIALSERVNDECKLDRSLPYLCHLLDEYIEKAMYDSSELRVPTSIKQLSNDAKVSSRVVCVALNAITTLLMSCSYITPINVLIFPEYLLPKLSHLLAICARDNEKVLIKIALAACFPYLARIAEKFWMMSKTFKNNEIKNYHTKMVSVTNSEEQLLNSYNTLSIPKLQLDMEFERLAFSLLTDPSPSVKSSLVANILPLCEFFGIDKTNDFILPHLITYLNDSDYQLRLSFLSSIIQLGPFIGVLSFEQYLLPLLIQTLSDHEQFVVIKVLEIFNHFVSERLINPKFNALSIYKELLQHSINLLLHPNEWIRQSVLNMILSISDNLLDADRYCFLYPYLERFLSYDITSITWNSVYPCLTKPLSKQVYELAVTWSTSSTSRSLFWQQKAFSAVTTIDKKHTTVSFSKSMGRSVYMPQINGFDSSEAERGAGTQLMANVPLSPEDRQWILKLKSVMLDEKDLWKVFALKTFISNSNRPISTSSADVEFDQSRDINVPPRNIFFDICYKSEPIGASSKVTETNVDSNFPDDSTSIISGRHDLNSYVLPNLNRVKASLQTVQANVFGELELSHEPSYSQAGHGHVHSTSSDANSTHKVFSINNQKIISVSMKHSYTGRNPFILNYLQTVDFQPSMEHFPEFGRLIKESKVPPAPKVPYNPKGACVVHLNTNDSHNLIDGINKVVVCPTSEFFVTGSELGHLKIWDILKLEKNVASRNASLSLDLKSAIVDIRFMSNRFVFAVATRDGLLRIFRIDVSRGKSKNIVKYLKIALVRSFKVDEGYASRLDFAVYNSTTQLIAITSVSKILGIDIIKMEKEFELTNPLMFGVPSSFIVGHNKIWLLLGTNEGVLTLWDLRFEIMLKAWKIKSKTGSNEDKVGIKKLVLLAPDFKLDGSLKNGSSGDNQASSYFAIIGSSKDSDISVWEIPTFECKEIYNSHVRNPKVKGYVLEEIRQDKSTIDGLLSSLSLEVHGDRDSSEGPYGNKSMTSLAYFKKGGPGGEHFLVSATWDKRLIVWNTGDAGSSCSFHNKNVVTFTRNRVSLLMSIVNEKITERKPDPGTLLGQADAVSHQDTITDIDVITWPFPMLVSVDRNGYVNLYK